jgi:ABC-type phosphate/phosphonate transport system permease subunit
MFIIMSNNNNISPSSTSSHHHHHQQQQQHHHIIIIIIIVIIVVIVIVINARTSDKYVYWGNKFNSSSSGILNPLPTLTNMLNGVTRSTYLRKGPKIDHPL